MKLVKTAFLLTLAAAAAGMLTSRARRMAADAGDGTDAPGTADPSASGAGIGNRSVDSRSPNAGERVQAALAGGDGALSGSALAHDDLLAPGSPRTPEASDTGIGDPMRGA